MFRTNIPLERKLRLGDFLRSIGYFGMALWAALFAIYPSSIIENTVHPWIQWLWLGVAFVGSLMAALGSILKIDIKLELPGILFMVVGPLLYFGSVLYRVVNIPSEEEFRLAGLLPLVVYTLLPVLFIMPRVFELYADVLTSKARQIARGRDK